VNVILHSIMSSADIYDLSISEQDLNDNEDAIKYFDYIYSIYQLEKILLENDKDTEDPKFVELAQKLSMDIDMAQILDDHLHPEFECTIKDEDFSKLAVLWKSSFKDAKFGDEINGGKVIGIFTLTIWIKLDENAGHEYCCQSCDCNN